MKRLLLRKQASILCGFLFISWLQTSILWAFDREELLPPSIWRIKTHLQITPAYKKAFGHSGKRIPLHQLLIRDPKVRKTIEGEVTREESGFEIEALYGFSEKWLFSGIVPLLTRKQSAQLTVNEENIAEDGALGLKAQQTHENLQSEEVQGIGDIEFHAFYVFNYTISHFFRGGLGMKIPTGSAGTPRGIYPIAIGDRQIDLLGMLHYTFYPAIDGLRHEIRGEFVYNFVGTRETLDGRKGNYYGSSIFEADYTLGYEQNNWLFESVFRHQLGTGSTINGEPQNDQFFVDTVLFSLGYGNLSDLETSPQSTPYQLRINFQTPLQGQNVPIAPFWQIVGVFYF